MMDAGISLQRVVNLSESPPRPRWKYIYVNMKVSTISMVVKPSINQFHLDDVMMVGNHQTIIKQPSAASVR